MDRGMREEDVLVWGLFTMVGSMGAGESLKWGEEDDAVFNFVHAKPVWSAKEMATWVIPESSCCWSAPENKRKQRTTNQEKEIGSPQDIHDL